MRIAYVCYWNLLEKDGVAKKINGQVAHWRAAGNEVEVFCVSRAEGSRPDWRVHSFRGLAGRGRATRTLERAVLAYAPDLAYLRYDLFLPPLGRLLRAIPTVVEIQTNDREEAKLRRVNTRAARLYNELNRHLLLSRAAGIVSVTHELAALPTVARHRKPTIVIGNGVDLDRMRQLPAPAGGRPRAVFLGSVAQEWHGVDKILWLAERAEDVDFHLVGYGPGDLPGPQPPNVVAHGVLAREEYEPILAESDVGIGTLALHRKRMTEACGLKVREYLGYGLPVVIGYVDTDLVDNHAWYVHRLPNAEANVRGSVDEIRAFIRSARGRRVPRAEVADRVGAHAKERIRLEFLQSVLRR